MIISKTAGYAIKVLLFLTQIQKQDLISVNTLHRELDIPYKYLGRLMSKLSLAGFVLSERGKYGGYQLRDRNKVIYLMDIIHVLDGEERLNSCLLNSNQCDGKTLCSMHKYWSGPKSALIKMLKTVSIQELQKDSHLLEQPILNE